MKKAFIFIILFPYFLFCQTPQKCGTPYLISQNSNAYKKAIDKTFLDAKEWIVNNKIKLSSDSVLNIPVVVHIIYENLQENLHDSLIYSQIEVLNRDFARLNSDTLNMRSVFDTIAAAANIQFFLATEDPAGFPTNGITRTLTSEASFMDVSFTLDLMKDNATGGVDAWPVEDYLNIWVCDLSIDFLGQNIPAILGYAYPPAGLPNWPAGSAPANVNFDGVVIHYEVFGRNNPYSSISMLGTTVVADMGRTCVHEVGHYLGLRHIWGDGDCTQDDGLADTPLADDQSQFDCNISKNSCLDNPFNFPDMVENYMDYSSEDCQNTFTQDQVNLMYSVLLNDRYDLLVLDTSNTQVSMTDDITVMISPNPAQKHFDVKIGCEINLNNGSLRLLDISGRTVLERKLNNSLNYYERFDIKNLQQGLYFLELSFSGIQTTYKTIVIQ